MPQQDLDAAHRASRRRNILSIALMGVGVAALVTNSVLRAQRDGGGTSFLVFAVLAAVVIGVVIVLMRRGTSGRHQRVVDQRPESHVREVWGAAGLKDALAAEGVDPTGVNRGQGTALSLATTAVGLELWRGREAELLVALPWSRIAQVAEGRGVVANDGAKPAVVLVTTTGTELVLLPARNPTGSLRTAPLDEVRREIQRLDGLRAAA